MPSAIRQEDPNHELVFSSYPEMFAHHNRAHLRDAEIAFTVVPPEALLIHELKRNGVEILTKGTDQ
jgi:hypothetical protein